MVISVKSQEESIRPPGTSRPIAASAPAWRSNAAGWRGPISPLVRSDRRQVAERGPGGARSGLGPYRYCGNAPTDGMDPGGLMEPKGSPGFGIPPIYNFGLPPAPTAPPAPAQRRRQSPRNSDRGNKFGWDFTKGVAEDL